MLQKLSPDLKKDPREPLEEPPKESIIPFPFLRLPRELRDHIYQYLLSHDGHREIWIRYSLYKEFWWDATSYCRCHGRGGFNPSMEKLTLGLLTVSNQIHTEALETLYGRNNIWVDANPRKALEFLSGLSPVARNRIRYLKLWIDPFPIEKEDTGRPSILPPFEEVRLYQEELLLPWQKLASFISEKLPNMQTLCITKTGFRPFSKWGPKHPNPSWAIFYHKGWAEALRNIPSLKTLELEMRVRSSGPDEPTTEELNGQRQAVTESRFHEKSVEWIYTFFETGTSGGTGSYSVDRDHSGSSVIPIAILKTIFVPYVGVRSGEQGEVEVECALSPLPEFVQKHTVERDRIIIRDCAAGIGRPARSPDELR
ncbi:hypothetical protein FQN54_002427 [Arachnomyces sp. PD_36]|nr:hypothetical protein FQN54_002427 [Arachnomyces sp. PD_36]